MALGLWVSIGDLVWCSDFYSVASTGSRPYVLAFGFCAFICRFSIDGELSRNGSQSASETQVVETTSNTKFAEMCTVSVRQGNVFSKDFGRRTGHAGKVSGCV